ncbi:c-type cytochrome biogenesis protein CcmI [Promicromonospora sp. MEB111]|uniref:c-type cytochrome biogenesis protein CcmI n=1 Tax=Promicromonospora sp. MEB111 TaxID=3040301 RepID=UPI002551A99D|nr:c-type cytochrome biogenesis protein CcmI [Promicromonospora sp. MEB111]
MGIFSGLLSLPLAPVRGTAWVAQQVLDEAERRYYDVETLRRQLEEVAMARENGELDDDGADALEEELTARLIEANRRSREERDG